MLVIYQDYSIDGENWLFPDAEILEDIPEDFVGGDFADDGTNVVDGLADVLGDKVGRKAGTETVLDTGQGGPGIFQGIDVAGIGDYDIVRRNRVFGTDLCQSHPKIIKTLPFLCRNIHFRTFLEMIRLSSPARMARGAGAFIPVTRSILFTTKITF